MRLFRIGPTFAVFLVLSIHPVLTATYSTDPHQSSQVPYRFPQPTEHVIINEGASRRTLAACSESTSLRL